MSQKPVIFLDFDDVLCVNQGVTSRAMLAAVKTADFDWAGWSELMLPEATACLRQLHGEFQPVYVISSTWATYFERPQIEEICRRTGLHFVADNLHPQWTTPRALSSSRLWDIQEWLEKHRTPKQPVLVIDDEESGWSLSRSPLDYDGLVVLCEQWRGFVADKLEIAQRLLRVQIQI